MGHVATSRCPDREYRCHATVNGVQTTYRIDVDDNAEPGAGRDTFKFQSDTGYTVGGVITKGNIQVHS
jgi:hypothetical protein